MKAWFEMIIENAGHVLHVLFSKFSSRQIWYNPGSLYAFLSLISSDTVSAHTSVPH